MTVREMRGILDCDLFEPFQVRRSSGDAYEVRNPTLAVFMRSRLFLAFPNSARWTLTPFLHIAAVESPAKGNSSRTCRRESE